VAIKVRNSLEGKVSVSFRLNDSDWRKTFSLDLEPGEVDSSWAYTPEESLVCHPYIDQVYFEEADELPMISQGEDTSAAE
jgi:hypothetical protein